MKKRNLRKSVLSGVIIAVFLSAVLCCCVTDTLHAQAPTPSCHSAGHNTEPSTNVKDCDCHQPVAIIQEGASVDVVLTKAALLGIISESDAYGNNRIVEAATPLWPALCDTSPLHVQFPILRI